MSTTNEPTVYEKVTTAMGYAPPETEAHKAGREAAEAVAETYNGAVKAVQDALTPEPPKPKTTGEVIDETLTQVKDATNSAIEQVSEAINPAPKPKTTGEVIGETYDSVTTQAGEYYEGAKASMTATEK